MSARARAPAGGGASGSRAGLGADDGVAGWEALPLGFLVLLVGALVAANAWAVVDAKMAVTAAAREGARAFVEAESPPVAAGAARSAADAALRAHGRSPDPAAPPMITGELRRCERVAVRVRHTVPAVVLPWVGGFGAGITVGAVHEEIVDPLRAGVPGAAGAGPEDRICGG